MPHALVTGGAGFIGSHLVDRLLATGWRVTCLDSFDPFYDRALKEANIEAHRRHPLWSLAEIDLRDSAALQALLPEGCDVIFHLAAKAGVRPSIQDPWAYQEVNVGGTQSLLEFARARGVRQFVFASSSSVYGVNGNVPWREDEPVLMPISPYAATKVAGELLGHVYSHLYGIRFIALRFFTVYGPRQRPDLAIAKFTRLIREGRPVPLYGDGSTARDYTFVSDTVDGVMAAAAYDASLYEIINLGNNQAVSLAGMIREIELSLGRRASIDRQPPQPGDVPVTCADIRKAADLLGYAPRTPFAEGIARYHRSLAGL
jgi:UDP-glucuronate 4-epimerase